MKMNLFTLAAAALLWCSAAPAHAEFITLVGRSSLRETPGAEEQTLSGHYFIANKGDETAINVYPELALGGWKWSGEPQILAPGEEKSWDVEQSIPYDELGCRSPGNCPSGSLPAQGFHYLRITRNFQDSSGRGFSSVDLQRLYIGAVDDQKVRAIRTGAVSGKMNVEPVDGKYRAEIELYNSGASPAQVSVSLHLPRELRAAPPSSRVSLPPGESAALSVTIDNFSGLPGSNYAFHVALEWEEEGLRNGAVMSGQVELGARTAATGYLYAAVAAAVIIGGLLYLFVFRRQ